MIIHADMDAFYASVEIREQPELADKPVAVGGPANSRGVISAANYIARQFGIHSAMPTSMAIRRCPDLVLLPGHMSLYSEVSQQIHEIFSRYTPLIEPLSLDEAFLDTRASEKLFGTSEQIAQKIKQDIRQELNLVVSIGVAPTRFVAKIASDVDKPDGFVVVAEDEVQDFLDPLPVTRIWGVGKSTYAVLKQHGIETIRDMRQRSAEQMLVLFGKHGEHLWQLANGIDPRRVIPEHDARSISHETTFATDIADRDILLAQLLHLTEQVAWRLRHKNLQGRTVQLKVRFPDFSTITRSFTLPRSTNNTDTIWHAAKDMLLNRVPKQQKALRLIGVGVSGFDTEPQDQPQQADLFSQPKQDNHRVDILTDEIKDRFGTSALQRGRTIRREPDRNE